MKIPDLKYIKEFSLLVISNHSGIQTKSYKLNFWKIAACISLYSFAVVLLTVLFLALTPAKHMFVSSAPALRQQNEEMNKLNKRIILLSGELEQITSLNRKLKYAIALGDSNLAKSFGEKPISERSIGEKSLGERSGSNNKNTLPEKKKSNVTGKSNIPGKSNVTGSGYLLGVIRKLFFTENEPPQKEIDFIFPVENRFVSRGFNAEKGHMGMDFPIKQGLPVFASCGGIVIFSDYTAQDGNMIILMHKNSYITIYKHCSALMKKLREKVVQGETIALSGNTGLDTSGPHLHFEIWKDGQAINPEKILTY